MNTTNEFIGIKKENIQRVTRMAVQQKDGNLVIAIAGQSQFVNNRKYLVFEFNGEELLMSISKVELAQNLVVSTTTLENESTELNKLFMKVASSIILNETFPQNYDAFDDCGELSILFYGKVTKVTLRFICDNLVEYIRQRVDNNFVNLTFKSNKYELINDLGALRMSI